MPIARPGESCVDLWNNSHPKFNLVWKSISTRIEFKINCQFFKTHGESVVRGCRHGYGHDAIDNLVIIASMQI